MYVTVIQENWVRDFQSLHAGTGMVSQWLTEHPTRKRHESDTHLSKVVLASVFLAGGPLPFLLTGPVSHILLYHGT